MNPPANAVDNPNVIERDVEIPEDVPPEVEVPEFIPIHEHDPQNIEHLNNVQIGEPRNLHMDNEELIDHLFNGNLPDEFIRDDQSEISDDLPLDDQSDGSVDEMF